MVSIYPLNHPYGNYLDGYYTRNYQTYAEYFKSLSTTDIRHNVNLGIQDGVTIIQNLEGDYKGYNMCIVEDENTSILDIYKIVSKNYIGSGMWNVTMIVDAFSKYYTDIIESTILINRLGYKNYNEFNPILFGQEAFTLSQVKRSQQMIPLSTHDTDKVHIGGYIMIWQKDALKEDKSVTFTYNPSQIIADYKVDGIDNFDLQNNEKLLYKGMNSTSYLVLGTEETPTVRMVIGHNSLYIRYVDITAQEVGNIKTQYYIGHTYKEYVLQWSLTGMIVLENTNENVDISSPYNDSYRTMIVDYIADNVLPKYKSYLNYSDYNGKYVEDNITGNVYKITITETSDRPTIIQTNDTDILNYIFTRGQGVNYSWEGNIRFGTNVSCYIVTLELVTTTNEIASGTTTITKKRDTTDQGYAVVFVPYFFGASLIQISEHNGSGTTQTLRYNQEITKTIMQQFYLTYGGDNGSLLDIQEFYGLPAKMEKELYDYFAQNWTTGNKFSISINDTEVTMTWRNTASASSTPVEVENVANIDQLLYYALGETEGEEIIDFILEGNENLKLEQQNTYHLCSPSGTSVYEFSLAKNNGLNGFRYKYNIRPYASVYQLQPLYSGYYGNNYTDTRGLAMEEPTSITLTSSEWETYKRQNVNYINSFESNQEYERSKLQLDLDYQKEQYKMTRVRSGMNSIMGASQSMSEGLLSGNIAGAAVSGVYNIVNEGINSAITQAQFRNYQKHQSDTLALSQAEERRQWEYSLQNIQALPYNTEKLCEIYNTNTHYFYIETYTPTDYEISMYSRYLDLFGIKIGGILPLSSYSFDYLEGNIVKLSIGVTEEEYQEIELELQSGRRLYEAEE